MNVFFERLKPKEQRGSKPRCHLLTHGSAGEVASRLTSLVIPFAHVSIDDRWMPDGFRELEEAQLDKAPRVLDIERRTKLASWWLPDDRQSARTPNFDIVSTCTVEGVPGLILIEAKAHEEELRKEEAGRRLATDASDERKASHVTIGAAIHSAAKGFDQSIGGSSGISRDTHYQMSNRFAWAWKLTELGVPVVLLYLGFLKADDMSKPGEVPFADKEAWEASVRSHSVSLFSENIWNSRWLVNGVPLIPLIKALEVPLEQTVNP